MFVYVILMKPHYSENDIVKENDIVNRKDKVYCDGSNCNVRITRKAYISLY